ncbi:hypothetical protein DL96DRAFT_1138537 [Flagelloscypha sp. PMI_526]|nr:hypothetical protein DL96DRAFT_1138537 [Flagelloscypha sp. PMI_526]
MKRHSPPTLFTRRPNRWHRTPSTAYSKLHPAQRNTSTVTELEGAPWIHVATTYQWVNGRHNQWRFEPSNEIYDLRFRQWPDVSMNCVEVEAAEAERWKRDQARTWRRHRERMDAVEEKIRGAERRIREKREMARGVRQQWKRHEETWEKVLSSPRKLSFGEIPWPTFEPPRSQEDLTPEKIEAFLLSKLHSGELKNIQRIRAAQKRWHPDRFQRVLLKIHPNERDQVDKAAGRVARCLNDMMAREVDKTL